MDLLKLADRHMRIHLRSLEVRMPEPRLLALNTETLWFEPSPNAKPSPAPVRRKIEAAEVERLVASNGPARFNQLRQQIMSKRPVWPHRTITLIPTLRRSYDWLL
jgi:hypothetical protein